MEKNQQNRMSESQQSNLQETTGNQPGQQLPAGHQGELDRPTSAPGKTEQHSESSLPQQDEETLGTP